MTVEMTPLPRGRHRLSRDEVVRSQRMRILRAMAETMAERGYAHTSVADVLRRARVSRETFYELFSSKEDCFMSAFEAAYGHILDALSSPPPGDAQAPGADRLSRVLEDYLDALARDPASARVFLIEVYAAGPAALERRLALQRGLVDAIAGMLGASGEERFAVEAVLAAIASMVTARVAAGDAAGVHDLHGPVLALVERLGLSRRAAAPVPR